MRLPAGMLYSARALRMPRTTSIKDCISASSASSVHPSCGQDAAISAGPSWGSACQSVSVTKGIKGCSSRSERSST